MKKRECLRCDHLWMARINNPKVCPKCKSPYWKTPKKKNYKLEEVK